MTYHSPERGYELRELEGDPTKIAADAASFVKLADELDLLETELRAIAESSVHRSKGTDALAEMAGKARPEVEKASTRYRGTGEALDIYAPALRTAQNWIAENKPSIEAAERDYEDAVDAAADARDDQSSLHRVWAWEDDPTDAERTAAATAVSEAEAAEVSAKSVRDQRWQEFETTFTTWSNAYEDAVDGVDGAIDAAGNNDGFWEGLADFLDILGWVVTGLAVLALFISGPIAALVVALVVIGSLVLLAGKIAQYSTGRTTKMDLGLAIFSVVTLGAGGAIARVVSKGAPTLSAAISTTRSTAGTAIRGTMRGPSLNPLTWHRPVSNRISAWSQARAATPKPNTFASQGLGGTPWNSIRFGGSDTGRTLQFLHTARGNLGKYPSVVSSIDTMIAASTPSLGSQVAQTSLWMLGTGADVGDKVRLIPKSSPLVPKP
ncbi:hypothetical protein [Agrococcus sp. Ld7]|uniref:hypothetical protein n=1 Tax=Agrococcus sp. Ld7 TaxID=649148 RepID=UPI003864D20F